MNARTMPLRKRPARARALRTHAVRALLVDALRRNRSDLAVLLAWSAVEAGSAFASGRLVELAVDEGFLAHRLLLGFGWLSLLAAAFVAGGVAAGQVFRRLGAVIEPMRDELARRVVEGSIRRSARLGAPVDHGGVARLTEQVEIAREASASVLLVTQGFVVTAIGAVVGLLTLIPEALVLVVPPVLLGLAIFAAALPKMARRQRQSIMADERAAGSAAQVTAGMRDIIASGAEATAASLVTRHIDAQADATRQLARLTALRTLAVATGGLVPVILILATGSWLRASGATTGAILGALTYVLQGVQPALQQLVRNLGSNGVWLVTSLERILAASSSDSDRAEAGSGVTNAAGAVAAAATPVAANDTTRAQPVAAEIRNLSFAYSPAANPIVEHLDITIAKGDHLAIVGPSGAGKSTLASLLAGLLEPRTGSVLVGGMYATAARAHGSALRALIPQEAYVFAGTALENLTYLNPDATRAQIQRSVAALGARDLVQRLGGYDALLNPSELSAGERQLITLVRAHLSPAALIILDEATCHLDPESEARAELAFTRRRGTLIVIAHRMSSAIRARHVLVLDGGIALTGTHEQLLKQSALYRNLAGYWSATDLNGPEGGEVAANCERLTVPASAQV